MEKTVVISLGGSLIYPDEIDTRFLKEFKSLIEKFTSKGYKFVIFCGGGKLARNFQNAASGIEKVSNENLDWIGIYATRLNALLVRYIFADNAQDPIIAGKNDDINFKKNIIIAAGWVPGSSTDYDAIIIAKKLGIKHVINMSNIDYVYDKDPRKFSDARKVENMKWDDLLKLTGTEWKAGLNTPFDPIAAKEAKKIAMKVMIVGNDLKNVENLLNGKKFKGTTIN